MSRLLAASLCLAFMPLAGFAQTSVPPNQVDIKGDTSSLKPPPGAKIAVIVYEDLECPACAHAFPIVHQAVNHYHLPIEEYDFQIPGHHWSHQAAIFAHYLKAKVSPQISEEFRRETFASQMRIASLDDLHNFEQNFMKSQGKQMPFVVDPTGQYDREVNDSTAAALKLGATRTPTIVVVTPTHWTQVADVDQMYAAIDAAEQEVAKEGPRTAPSNAHRTTAARH